MDLGYVLGRAHWRQGYMSEAISAFAQEALALPPIFRLQATCDMDNLASARTLEKSGFRREGLLASRTVHPNISAEPRACFTYARCRDR
ncbi:GNAT family N-acetyltransferase [Chitinimonas sp. JJ19]|uniref:GNAT family N-acetyltransferase n=1 Tax=Chitinimonas sp. JJ19 TaxID=3109352 RepID=UPI003000D2DB